MSLRVESNISSNTLEEQKAPPPPDEGVIERVKKYVASLRERLPDLSFVQRNLSFSWDTLSKIEWKQKFSLIKDYQWFKDIKAHHWIQILKKSSEDANISLLDDILKVVTTSILAIKRYFADYTLLQKLAQSPGLLFGVNGLYRFHSLYLAIVDYFDGCPDENEKWLRIGDLSGYVGTLFDDISHFMRNLGEAAFISSQSMTVVPRLIAASIAFQMVSQFSIGSEGATLKTWCKELSDKNPLEQLTFFKKQTEPLLNRLFVLKTQEKGKSAIISKIEEVMVINTPDKIENLAAILMNRAKTRIEAIDLSLQTNIIGGIGVGIRELTPFTIIAHLTSITSAVLAIKYMQNEMEYAQKFEDDIRLGPATSKKD